MDIVRTYKHNGLDAFQLILDCNNKFGHSVKSTIPIEYLRETDAKFLEKIRDAYIPYESNGIELLDELATRIKKRPESFDYYYPIYLLTNGVAPTQLAKNIYKLDEVFFAFPGTHFCATSFPVEFFVMRGWYYAKRDSICKNAQEISLAEFEDNLSSIEMKMDYHKYYRRITNNAYALKDGGKTEFMLLTNINEKLLMVLSL